MNTLHIYPQHLFKSCTVPWFSSSSSRLLCFLIVSLTLHGLLIAVFPKLELSLTNGRQVIHQPIYLTLNNASANRPITQQPLTTHHPVSTKPLSRHTPPISSRYARIVHTHPLKIQTQTHSAKRSIAKTTLHHGTPTHDRRVTKEQVATTVHRSEKNISKPSPNPAAVAALLRRALQQHFQYPLVALQNSWEGKVVLGIRVTADGRVATARVLKASGFRILDRAAQHAANKIGRLSAAPPLLAGQALTFRVPVAYRLRR